jgi:outer membrane protein
MHRIWIVLLGAGACAQTPAPVARPAVLPLSLAKAVEMALAPEGNTRVRIASELIHQAETRAVQARSALLPNFDAAVSEQNTVRNLKAMGIDFSAIPAVFGFRIPSVAGPFNVFDARVSGSQSVFDFSTIRRLQAARSAAVAVRAEVQGTRNQVADQVSRAYLAALRAEAALATAQANLELSEALVKLAESRKTAGTGTGIEITRAQVQLANDRQRRIVVTNERERTRLQLLRVVGLKLDGELQLTSALDYKPVEAPPLDRAVEAAIGERAELKAQMEREHNANLSYSATKWERLPSVAFFGDYGSSGSGIDASIPTRTYGLSMRVPIFDGGRRDARRAESLSQLRQERLRTGDLKEQIELEVRLALEALRSADAQVAAALEGVDLAGKELTQARRRYEAGVTSSIEITDAQTRLDRARDNQIAALFNHNLARIDLATATGAIQQFAAGF